VGDAFIGYQEDTVAAVVFQAFDILQKESDLKESKEVREHQVHFVCKSCV